LSLEVTYTATDFGQDSKSLTGRIVLAGSTSSLISFDADGPSVRTVTRQTALIEVDADGPDGLAGQLSTSNTDAGRAGEFDIGKTAVATGNDGALNALVDFGLDGAHATTAFELVDTTVPAASGFYSKADQIFITVSAGVLRGTAGGREVFTLT